MTLATQVISYRTNTCFQKQLFRIHDLKIHAPTPLSDLGHIYYVTRWPYHYML